MKRETAQIAYTALFLAVGLLLPQALHPLGLGQVLLPIQLGVLVGSFILRLRYCVILGVLTPVFGYLIFGMPAFPVFLVVAVELTAYAVFICVANAKTRAGTVPTLLLAMLVGRAASVLAVLALSLAGARFPLAPWAFVTMSLVKGIPGAVVQVIVVPLCVAGISRLRGEVT